MLEFFLLHDMSFYVCPVLNKNLQLLDSNIY
jgi:hypothetical protein